MTEYEWTEWNLCYQADWPISTEYPSEINPFHYDQELGRPDISDSDEERT